MKLHRFYVNDMELDHEFWMQDKALFHQWTNVLRFQVGRELSLFNANREERLYKIVEIGDNAVHLELLTELEPTIPKRDLYLCFSLLKKDKNEWILQKGTELGVRHFIPLFTDRTEKTGFDVERAKKIAIEAAEQCGRTDIPRVRDPINLETAIKELSGKIELFVADEHGSNSVALIPQTEKVAIFIGPEGGWTEEEKQLFIQKDIKHTVLSAHTLRAETAAITAAALLQ